MTIARFIDDDYTRRNKLPKCLIHIISLYSLIDSCITYDFLTFYLFLVHLVTSKNAFGKQQSDIDLAADDIIFKNLEKSGVVYAAASEEKPRVSSKVENHLF